MELVHNIENTMRGLYKDLPHLPKEISKWLAHNAWWLTVIGVGFGVLGILGALSVVGIGATYVGIIAPAAGIALMGAWVWILFFAAVLLIEAKAIMPLKAMQRKGWELLFLAMLVAIVGGLASELLRGNLVGGLISGLIGFAIGAYVLLEIDQYFGAKVKK